MSISKPYKCEYCGASFTKEKTLAVHMCEKKRRRLQKDEKRVQTGYYAFTRFYKLSAGNKKEKTYEDFCASPYYNAFVKFGSFVNNVRPLYPEKYIDYVVTGLIAIAPEYNPSACGHAMSETTLAPPADSPMIVTCDGSPPNDAMLLRTHCNALT